MPAMIQCAAHRQSSLEVTPSVAGLDSEIESSCTALALIVRILRCARLSIFHNAGAVGPQLPDLVHEKLQDASDRLDLPSLRMQG